MKNKILGTPAIIAAIAFAVFVCEFGVAGASAGLQMVLIKGGKFTMGSPNAEPKRSVDEKQHAVTVSNFYMSKYEVTQKQYEDVMGYNPSFHNGANLPVDMVTWFDAVEFCNKLSEKEGLQKVYTITGRTPASGYPITNATVTADWTKKGYRLPTEAEWEYACRAGKTTTYNTGDTISDNTGWYGANSERKTHEVGKKPANAWGLYDMHGNVSEWCWDWSGTYPGDGGSDYTGPVNANVSGWRVQRGGSNNASDFQLRSAYRGSGAPNSKQIGVGFRVVRR